MLRTVAINKSQGISASSLFPNILFHRLNANDAPRTVVSIPNDSRRSALIDPYGARMRVRLGHRVFRPLPRSRIKSKELSSVQFSAPHFAVLVGFHGV